MLIYMIRHGQTDWNAEGRLQGQQDVPLNALGRSQASRNGERLAAELGDAAETYDYVSSPLGRTRETMERVRAAMGLDPAAYRTETRLMELSFGDWQGFTLAELRRQAPDRVEARRREKWDFIPPGEAAESYEILSWRVGAWLTSVDRPTVCVSHGGVVRSVFRLIGKWSQDAACNMNVPQDRILKIDRDGGTVAWL
ncbi:histidine phosphatase family protein [Ciceribacter sp. RN22]|uniref:histidine phosphatase family protein n=1 Tax=Ciceribacter sp. RN22 TaxID=2954932 RepID=UPI0020936F9D|nr:histidine phosphatase family protein [Ciceribacter sp. RN22]MCO6177338.1 phosphoglycerate mutase family protein [Ciceribacter sp. RN22]